MTQSEKLFESGTIRENDTVASIAFNMAGAGAATLRVLQQDCGNASLYEIADPRRTQFALLKRANPDIAARIEGLVREGTLAQELDDIARYGITVITQEDAAYPESLRHIAYPPLVLYVQGEFKKTDRIALAVVGTRRPSCYGITMARKFSSELASYGVTVVSGFAKGIDIVAHQAALAAGGRTIAVLGTGLRALYPREHARYVESVARHGALVSEFPLRTPAYRHNFPRRNRIISGLSLGTLVVEAPRKSGALVTAHYALDQNNDVFAVPGAIDTFTSQGSHALIKQGAKLVESLDDILEELAPYLRDFVHKENRARAEGPLEGRKKALLELLREPRHLEVMAHHLTMPLGEITRTLLEMQLEGAVREVRAKTFVRKGHTYAR